MAPSAITLPANADHVSRRLGWDWSWGGGARPEESLGSCRIIKPWLSAACVRQTLDDQLVSLGADV